MKAKEYLKQIEKLDTLIENKMIEMKQWKDIALGITAHSEGDRVQASGSKQRMADAVNRCVDMDNEISHLIDTLVNLKRDVTEVIEQLNATEYDLLHKVYIQHMTFIEVAVLKNRSKEWVKTVHGRALHNVQKILDKSGKTLEKM